MRRIKEDLAILDIPRSDLKILPGYGWRPPDGTIIKINTDAAIHLDGGNGGAGGVARAASRLLGAQSKTLVGVMNPLIAEAMSVREGVRFANLRGFQEVIIETDCLEVVELWKNRHNSFAVVAPLFYEIGELATAFSYFDILHVIRSANYPAHLCAKRACTLSMTESWLEETPSFLVSSLLADDPANAFV